MGWAIGCGCCGGANCCWGRGSGSCTRGICAVSKSRSGRRCSTTSLALSAVLVGLYSGHLWATSSSNAATASPCSSPDGPAAASTETWRCLSTPTRASLSPCTAKSARLRDTKKSTAPASGPKTSAASSRLRLLGSSESWVPEVPSRTMNSCPSAVVPVPTSGAMAGWRNPCSAVDLSTTPVISGAKISTLSCWCVLPSSTTKRVDDGASSNTANSCRLCWVAKNSGSWGTVATSLNSGEGREQKRF